MKRLVNTSTALLLLFSALMATTANAETKRKYAPTPKDMEELCEKLIELESNEISTFSDIKDYVRQVENLAVAYYHGDTSSKSESLAAATALEKVKEYADNIKASGSTRDMMECGILNAAIFHYKTGVNSEKLSAQIILPVVDAIIDEINAWQKLENTLNDYYAYAAFMENEGGSMASIVATGTAWSLAEARYNDTEMLLTAGIADKTSNIPMSDKIREQANTTVTFLTSTAKGLLDCEDYFKENPYYKEVSKGLTEACKNLKTDMEAWINARLSVVGCLQEQGIGIGETFKLLNQIKTIGTPEQ